MRRRDLRHGRTEDLTAATFVLASALILLTPGPTNTLLAAAGAVSGARRALALPLAEALGYAIAVSAFAGLAGVVDDIDWAMPVLKAIAAGWLSYSALKLWRTPSTAAPQPARQAFTRILVTTMLNPKAMLVGTLMIPQAQMAPWICLYVAMAYGAGLGWVMLGAHLPRGVRPYAYKSAALVLALFAAIAAGGAVAA